MEDRSSRQVYLLDGLNCSGCAAQIEQEIGKLAGVAGSSVDFTGQKLAIGLDGKIDENEIYAGIIRIVGLIESQVKVSRQDAVDNETIRVDSEAPEGGWAKRLQHIPVLLGVVALVIALIPGMAAQIRVIGYLAAYLLFGWNVLYTACLNILHRRFFDENLLMAIATLGACAIGAYPEAAAVMFFYRAGEFLQDRAVGKSRKSISALLDIRPAVARLKTGTGLLDVSPETVAVGEIIVVRPGDRVPLDGKVVAGSSFLDVSALTGESMPCEAEAGVEVLSGSINLNGLLEIRVSKVASESTVTRILAMVEEASHRKAQTEKFMTRISAWYTPMVVAAAALVAVLPPIALQTYDFQTWIYRALVFLVVSCPCALLISIPLGFIGGIGCASRHGILLKGGYALEVLAGVDQMIFDKTGTLTYGMHEVTAVKPWGSFSRQEVLEYAALVESASTHPVAKAVVRAAGQLPDRQSLESFVEHSGLGVEAAIAGKEILCGRQEFLKSKGIAVPKDFPSAGAATLLYLVIDGVFAGCIEVADTIKDEAKETIHQLRALGVDKQFMLTGDNRLVAQKVAESLGLDAFEAELLPDGKVAAYERISKAGSGKTAFVGDGINDSPVIALADLGIAMGSIGSDAAIEAADVVIMSDDISSIPTAILISRATKRIVWQNIGFAFGVKAIVLLLGAFGIATIWEAVFADVGVALLAVMNSMRVLRLPIKG